MYRIPLTYLCDLGKTNFPTKIDLKIRCTLQTDMKQFFESKKKVAAIGAPDAQIVFVRAPYLQYEQILLTKNFRQYLETIMLSSKVLRMGMQKTPYQKTYELQARSQEFTVALRVCSKLFDWLEISLLYDKSDKHLTIYDSYNAKCATRMIKKSSYRIYWTRTAQQIWWSSISRRTPKNIYYGNNMLPGIVTVIPPRQFPTTSTIPCFRSFCSSQTILALSPMKKSILICGTVSDT